MIFYKNARNSLSKLETYKDIDTLNREINVEYQPSIAGYLLSSQLKYKDLMADIMNLYAEKIIDLDIDTKTGKKVYQFYIQDLDYKNKIHSTSDIYIIENLILKQKNQNFDFETWKNKVLEQYQTYNFSKTRKSLTIKQIIKICLIIDLVLAIIPGIIYMIIKKSILEGVLCITLLLPIVLLVSTIPICIIDDWNKKQENHDLHLNEKGKEELKKWLKFKKFISQYTLIKERTVEEIEIFEKYIPYAVALKENITYKNTKFDIFDESEMQKIIEGSNIVNMLEGYGVNFEK